MSEIFSFCFLFPFLQTQIQNMKDLNTGIDCSVGDFNSAAGILDDLANIIQDVGINELKNQLGVDIDFNAIGQY